MQQHAAVFRDGDSLREGVVKMDEVYATMTNDLRVDDRSMIWNTDLVEAIRPLPKDSISKSIANLDKVRYAQGAVPVSDMRLKMQKTMQQHAAVFRDGDSLREGVVKMDEVYATMTN